MKRVSYVFALLIAVTLVPRTASAVDLVTDATVTIVEGITIVETTPLNFGTLVADVGDVVVDANAAVAPTDATFLIFDSAAISPGVFDVASVVNQGVTVSVASGAGMPTGITLGTWTMLWNDTGASAAVGAHTIANTTDVLNIGATISLAADAPVAAAQALPYTLTIVFN